MSSIEQSSGNLLSKASTSCFAVLIVVQESITEYIFEAADSVLERTYSMETIITAKGQIVIPASIRQRLGIKEGTRIKIEERDNEIILKPITREYIHSGRGRFRGKGLMKALLAEKSRERDL
jgi:AbrB family looped-hinge helix DNA binding protein